MQFETPVSRKPWILLAALVFAWVGCICTANAQTSEPQVVQEESTCQPILQVWNGAQLLQLKVDPETLAVQALYLKVIDKDRAILVLLERANCESPWRATKAFPLTRKKPACEETDTTKCL